MEIDVRLEIRLKYIQKDRDWVELERYKARYWR